MTTVQDFINGAKDDLVALRAKARAHDAYLAAMRKMSVKQHEVSRMAVTSLWNRGYLACLRDFDQAVLDAATEQEVTRQSQQQEGKS